MYDEHDDSREELLELARKRKQRKRIFAFVLAVVMLVTFAIPIRMMFHKQHRLNFRRFFISALNEEIALNNRNFPHERQNN